MREEGPARCGDYRRTGLAPAVDSAQLMPPQGFLEFFLELRVPREVRREKNTDEGDCEDDSSDEERADSEEVRGVLHGRASNGPLSHSGMRWPWCVRINQNLHEVEESDSSKAKRRPSGTRNAPVRAKLLGATDWSARTFRKLLCTSRHRCSWNSAAERIAGTVAA